jgi:hypothetical protein
MKYLVLLLFCLFGTAFVHAQDYPHDYQPLLTDAQLSTHLDALDKVLPDLERLFNGIDPARQPGLDYQTGKSLEYDKQTGVTCTNVIRKAIYSLRQKRTVYDEVVLQLNLAQIHELLDDLMDSSVRYKALNRFAIASNELTVGISENRIGDDVMKRVRLLEQQHSTSR